MVIGWNRLSGNGEADFIQNQLTESWGQLNGGFAFINHTDANVETTLMRILGNGNVGIGTPDPAGYKLAVNGTVRAKEVKVETGWYDYVFDKGYKLRPITVVSSFIKTNHHLPEVPSALEVEKNGINLEKSNAVLLKKIEEFTLYMIETNK